jgi:hypothetical protein
VLSGGQTGVVRAALDAARALGIRAGGWCPRGRRAEDGRIPRRYRLAETPSREYGERTRWNVRDSDGTLIVTRGMLDGGTLLTARLAREVLRKPLFIVRLGRRIEPARFAAWLCKHRIRVLNVAGPRESKRPGIYRAARSLLMRMLGAGAPTQKRRRGLAPATRTAFRER